MKSILADTIVLSIPHSGTRALCKKLDTDVFTHFPAPESLHAATVHIPMRNPLDVAESWARRGKSLFELVRQYDMMHEYMEEHSYALHKVENIERSGYQDVKRGGLWTAIKVKWYRMVIRHYVWDVPMYRQTYPLARP